MSTDDWVKAITIPVFTGVTGWLINYTGLIMLFEPVRFHGLRVPGLRELAMLLPRKLQEVPGIMQGGVGWQGVLPSRAAKMGSIWTDKAISKIGTPQEFYQQLEPQKMATHIVSVFEPEVPSLVDRTMRRNQPELWEDVPPRAKQAVYRRVRDQLPEIVEQITDEIGEYIDQLLDPKLMVVNHFERDPGLVNRIFRDIGKRELRMMVNFGFLFGFLFGIPMAAVNEVFKQWWLLPIMAVIVGWTTNLLGIWLIFEPAEPRRLGPLRLHGLFVRRQHEVAKVYADIIADDVITLENIGDFLLNGPRSDRTRQMLEDAMSPAIDRAVGPLKPAVRMAVGARSYDNIRDSFATATAEHTMTGFRDPDFSRQQSEKIRKLFVERVRELPHRDFVEMLRSGFKEDEWMLYAHGAIMGLFEAFIHLGLFGV
ncbi:MAG: hypothetical protein M3Z27_06815 [Actinomycetota bacterium]|nr:hypothetical protein [Actinomycetota bacterium]